MGKSSEENTGLGTPQFDLGDPLQQRFLQWL
jgi:hypothetical protein